jgi:hypothetical protein
MRKVQNAIILNKYNVDYFQCQKCYFLCTEKPYWLEEAYKESINITDTGLIGRNINLSKVVSILCYFLFNDKKYLDFGGGYGILTRILRDVGFDFYWHDPYTRNLFAKGFEYNLENRERLEAVTSFETFEHFPDPVNEINKIVNISDNVIFTTELYNHKNVPDTEEWWYYSLEHGQHISFYSLETLKFIAKKYNMNLYSNKRDIHLLSKKRSKIKIYLIFILFNNSAFFRLSKEVVYIYIKFVKKSKTLNDMFFLKK